MRTKIFFGLLLIVLTSCTQSKEEVNLVDDIQSKSLKFFGNTQGTTYAILVNDTIEITYKEIDETLHQFDLSLSSYIPNSILSKLNNFPAGTFKYKDSLGFFNECVKLSRLVYNWTNGSFDPTVYPLVDGWGFMKSMKLSQILLLLIH